MSSATVGSTIRRFGIRHHGPGSARSLVAALRAWLPNIVLIEGPPEAETLLPQLSRDDLVPPVAMLFYVLDAPQLAVHYPLAHFSPEYQAIRWANEQGCPVRMIDLPATAALGLSVESSEENSVFGDLAAAAGFGDVEDWWEHLVEHRKDPQDLFEGLETLMAALRSEPAPTPTDNEEPPNAEDAEPIDPRLRRISEREFEEVREAHMRLAIRAAVAEGHARIAVVCGAWHTPALRELPPAKRDEAQVKGLPKLKVGATLVPWTYDRLTIRSGYGAGVRSPAFYDLVWNSEPEQVASQWLLHVARLLREHDLDAAPATVIEALRMAEALAALRGTPRPGLRDLTDACRATLLQDTAAEVLIARHLVVGERLGEVPPAVPSVPLLADLAAHVKRLRLKQDDTDRRLELDLRGDVDRERSELLHRLALLNVPWGVQSDVTGKKGTFHEHWRIQWQPELTIRLIEAGIYGNTLESAAAACAVHRAEKAHHLADIAQLVERVLIANLPAAVGPVVERLQAISALTADVAELADALAPLAATLRYGTVRKTDAAQVRPILEATFARLCVGLPAACLSLDEDAAKQALQRLGNITAVIRLFEEGGQLQTWLETLASLASLRGGHPLVSGKAERLRFDLGAIDANAVQQRLARETSSGASALETAAFVEGLLDGPAAILLHQTDLFAAMDDWLVSLEDLRFEEVLPLIRRTFALFSRPERRQLGERVLGAQRTARFEEDINIERGRAVLPVVRLILGVPND